VQKLLADGFLGDLRELVVLAADDAWRDASRPYHWRQDRTLNGLNTLALGIMHESAMRWTPATTRVFAQSTIFEPKRPSPDGGGESTVTVSDSVQVLTQLENGARGLYHVSGVTLHGPGNQIHLYGSRGTIKLEASPRERLLVGGPGDAFLDEVHVPHDQHGGWRVEEEFIAAIRGSGGVHFTDFVTGVKYMEFTEAVARSAATNLPVDLPLPEFAHVHDT
jgi:predicted dehydrogenase